MEIKPAGNEPEGQRERGRRAQDEQSQVSIHDRGLVICQLAEKSAKAFHANRHSADSLLSPGLSGHLVGVFDFERTEAVSCEQASGVQVVSQASETRFLIREQIVDQSTVGACSGHDYEVTELVAVFELANWNIKRRAPYPLQRGF